MIGKLILPGLIDPHVHLRDPEQINKEDFYTGTCAALAGGFTTILDMPNNKTPITTIEKLNEKIEIARKKIVCDVGFYFGSLGDNLKEFEKVKKKVMGLKLYLNQTTGNFLIDKKMLKIIFLAWNNAQSLLLRSSRLLSKPVLVHAEESLIQNVIEMARKTKTMIHVCHVSSESELKQIIKAKRESLKITCGVTPHHLFLTEKDVKNLGSFGKMKPPLQSKKNQDFLWKNLEFIDVVESDHAPHTIEEKGGWARGDTTGRAPNSAHLGETQGALVGGKVGAGPRAIPPTLGVPGLETTLPLLLTAVSEKRLIIDDIVRLCHTNPAKIFGIKTDPGTKIIVDLNSSFIIHNSSLFTKCGWSPFEGRKVKGKILRVFIRGKKVFENGKILAKAGSGKVIKP